MQQLSIRYQKSKSLKYFIQRLFLCLFCFNCMIVLNGCYAFSQGAYNITPEGISNDFMKVRILDSISYTGKTTNKIPFTEISDIAWDADENILYAISDEGLLYHLKLIIKNNKLSQLNLIKAKVLKDKNGSPLKGKFSDSEGLTLLNANNKIKGDTKLIISFENKPRIEQFTTNGRREQSIKIPKKLTSRKNYRHNNKALESVVFHPKLGFLTAAERSVKSENSTTQVVYSDKGKEWKFNASKDRNSSITALEVLSNGDVLILERAYNGPFTPIVITLRELKINVCEKKHCAVETLARFDGSDGWSLDNFEGLTRLSDNQYLMVSDDNNNPLQNTLWVLFEIKSQPHKIMIKIK